MDQKSLSEWFKPQTKFICNVFYIYEKNTLTGGTPHKTFVFYECSVFWSGQNSSLEGPKWLVTEKLINAGPPE